MGRSIMAIVVGFIVIGSLSFGADALMRQWMPDAWDSNGRVDKLSTLLLITAYVSIFAILGCYLTAWLAPRRPMLHALILGGLGLAFNVAAMAQVWDTAPAWWNIMSLVLVMPLAWIGGRIREKQLEAQTRGVRFAES